tara:strand:+ start:2975 stop:3994 length:1020 start_codon:yes stop_codon:yes gene_type:complete
MSRTPNTSDLPLVVLTNATFPETRAMFEDSAQVVANLSPEPWPDTVLRDHCSGASAIMTFMTDRMDGDALDRMPHLKIVACALKGFDSFDIAACTERGVWVTIVPDLLTVPTAELAVGLAIGLTRHVMAGDAHVRSGAFKGWRPSLYGTGFAGSTVGILGMGRVGCALADRLKGFDPRLVVHDAQPLDRQTAARLAVTEMSAEEIAATSDILFVCLPLNAGTRHLIDADFIAKIKPGAYLVNPGRGSVVDEAAVADALKSGHLAGYAADVFEMEDWSLADRPRAIAPDLLAMTDKTLFTPHLGSAVREVRIEIEKSAARSILQVLSGERPDGAINQVDD